MRLRIASRRVDQPDGCAGAKCTKDCTFILFPVINRGIRRQNFEIFSERLVPPSVDSLGHEFQFPTSRD